MGLRGILISVQGRDKKQIVETSSPRVKWGSFYAKKEFILSSRA